MSDLPKPDSEELIALIKNAASRSVYGVLYNNQDRALTLAEIRDQLDLATTEQSDIGRRLRELDLVFIIDRPKVRHYQLLGILKNIRDTSGISKTLRAEVLKSQRCAQCGRTPLEDHVKLHADHKIPREWNGPTVLENLQPLCSECNEGKRNFYATFDDYVDEIKVAINYDEPHRRIGELLKIFNGKPVPSELLERVANVKQYQDDWQKRMRELRVLGWEIKPIRKKEAKRVKVSYILEHFKPWPEGSIRTEITRLERLRKSASK